MLQLLPEHVVYLIAEGPERSWTFAFMLVFCASVSVGTEGIVGGSVESAVVRYDHSNASAMIFSTIKSPAMTVSAVSEVMPRATRESDRQL